MLEATQQTAQTPKAPPTPVASDLISQSLAKEKPVDAGTEVAKAAEAKAADAAAAEAGKAPVGMVSLADVQKMIDEGVTKAVEARTANTDQALKRDQWIRDHMKNLPPSLTRLLPMTGDADALWRASDPIEKEMKEWFTGELKRAGVLEEYYRKTNVGGANRDGGISITEYNQSMMEKIDLKPARTRPRSSE